MAEAETNFMKFWRALDAALVAAGRESAQVAEATRCWGALISPEEGATLLTTGAYPAWRTAPLPRYRSATLGRSHEHSTINHRQLGLSSR
jgi:hypothetical protein